MTEHQAELVETLKIKAESGDDLLLLGIDCEALSTLIEDLVEYVPRKLAEARIAELEGRVDIEEFCRWLEKWGYLDCDWWAEEPTVLDKWARHKSKDTKP